MIRRLLVAAVAVLACLSSGAATAQPPAPGRTPATIFVQPTDDGFQTYIVAAIIKKKVPANVVEREALASLRSRQETSTRCRRVVAG